MLPPIADLRFVVPDHIVSRVVDGTTVLLDTESGRTFSLDEVGTRAWSALTDTGSADAAVRVLADQFTAPSQVIAHDLSLLIEQLASHDLLRIQPR